MCRRRLVNKSKFYIKYRNLSVVPASLTLGRDDVSVGKTVRAFVDEYVKGVYKRQVEVTSATNWVSADENIATVAHSDIATVKPVYGSGFFPTERNVDITVVYNGTIPYEGENRAICKVTVEPEGLVTHYISVEPTTATIGPTGKVQLKVLYHTVTDGVDDGGVDATTSCSYASNSQIITVSNSGLVTANNTGETEATTNITVSYSGVDSVVVSVVASPAVIEHELLLVPQGSTTLGFEVGCTFKLYYITKINGTEASRVEVTSNITWDPIARERGYMTGTTFVNEWFSTAQTTVNVCATYNGIKSNNVVLTLNGADSITYALVVTPSSNSIKYNGTSEMSAEYVTYVNGNVYSHEAVQPGDVSWSENSDFASISSSGVLQANNTSSADTVTVTVTGTYLGVSGTANVTVGTVPALLIDGKEECEATATTHIRSQGNSYYYTITSSGVSAKTIGTVVTSGRSGIEISVEGQGQQLRVILDGTKLADLGLKTHTCYVDVTGTSIYGEAKRARLILTVKLDTVNMKLMLKVDGAPNATYTLYVDDEGVVTGNSEITKTYVAYSEHTLKVVGNVTTTSQYDPQIVNINVLGNEGVIDPNSLSMSLGLSGSPGWYESSPANTRFMGDGTINVSFGHVQNYIYKLTTTQAGCKVVIGGNTVTSSSTANYTYTVISVETSLPYSVTKDGFYDKTGTIIGPNRNITVTLDEIVDAYVDVSTNNANLTIKNETDETIRLVHIGINLVNKNGQSLTMWMYPEAQIDAHGQVNVTGTSSSGHSRVLANTSLSLNIEVASSQSSAGKLTFTYPEWTALSSKDMVIYQENGSYNGTATLPILTEAEGRTYVFPLNDFKIVFKNI